MSEQSTNITKEQIELAKDLNSFMEAGIITEREADALAKDILNTKIKTLNELENALDIHREQNKELQAQQKLRNAAMREEERRITLNEDLADTIMDQKVAMEYIYDLGTDIHSMDKKVLQTKMESVTAEYKKINALIASGDLTEEQLASAREALGMLDGQAKALTEIANTKATKTGKAIAAGFAEAASKAEELGAGVDKMFAGLPGGGAISKVLGLDDAGKKMQEGVNVAFSKMNEEMAKGGGLMGGLRAGAAGFNAILSINPMLLVVGAATALWGVLSDVDKQAQSIADATNMNFAASEQLYESTVKRNTRLGEELATTKDLLAVQQQVIASMGSAAQLSQETASAVADLGASYGYGAQTAGEVQTAMMEMGVSAEEAAESQSRLAADATRSYVDAGAVMQDIAKNGKQTFKYLGGNQKALEKAAIAGAKLGLSLQDMTNMADGLLNIEDSLSRQYEFQALSGKQINLDKARQLALDGDLAGMAEEVAKQAGSYADFQKMGRLEKEALADSLGMEVEDLGKSLAIQQQRGKLTKDELAAAQGLGLSAEELAGMTDKDIKAAIAKKNESAKTAKAFEDMKETLKSYLLPIANALGQAMMFVLNGVKSILSVIQPVASFFKMIWDNLGPIQGVLKAIVVTLGTWWALSKIINYFKERSAAKAREQLQTEVEAYELQKRKAAMDAERQAAQDAINNKVAQEKAEIQGAADATAQLNAEAEKVDANLKTATADAKELGDAMANASDATAGPQDAVPGGGGKKGFLGKAKGLLGKATDFIGGGPLEGLKSMAGGIGSMLGGGGGMASMLGGGGAIGSLMGVGDLAIDPNGGPVVTSPREGGIYQGTKNDGVSMSPSHGGAGGGAPAIDYNALGAAVAAAIAANPPQINLDGSKISQSVTATQSRNKGL